MNRIALLALGAVLALPLATPVQADDARAAQAAVKAGMRAYDLGKHEEAMAKLEEAYRLKGDPHLLFNMGQVYWKWGKDEDARRVYESYLRNLPDANNRGLVEERLAKIERRKKEKEPAAPPIPEPEATAPVAPPVAPAAPLINVPVSEPSLAPAPATSTLPPGPPPIQPAPSASENALVSQGSAEPQVQKSHFYKKWWFWTGTGAVVVAAVVVGVVLATQKDSPHGSLGEFGPRR